MNKHDRNLFRFYMEYKNNQGDFITTPILAYNHSDAVKKGRDLVRIYARSLGKFLQVSPEWDNYRSSNGVWLWRRDLTEAQIADLDRLSEESCVAS